MRSESTRAGGKWAYLMRLEAEPEPEIVALELGPPPKPIMFPLWSVAHIDPTALEVLARLFDESVYDFETRYITLRSSRAGRKAHSLGPASSRGKFPWSGRTRDPN